MYAFEKSHYSKSSGFGAADYGAAHPLPNLLTSKDRVDFFSGGAGASIAADYLNTAN